MWTSAAARRRPIQAALSLAALLALWLLLAPPQLGGSATLIVIDGNSMEPLYRRGDLVLVRPAPHYQVGDIVTYRHPTIGPVIHRVIGREGDRWVFQGDNNDFIDPYRPRSSELIGRSQLHLPRLGAGLIWLRGSPLLLALAAVLGVSMLTVKPRGRRGPSPPPGPALTGAREWAMTIVGVLALAALGLAGLAFSRPAAEQRTAELPYSHEGRFSYSADAPPGLYDGPRAQSGAPVFLGLSRALDVAFAYQLSSPEPAEIQGRARLDALLTAQNGWSRALVLAPERPLRAAQAELSGQIDLGELATLIARYQEQTGLRGQQFALLIQPRVELDGALAGQPLQTIFAPQLEFRLDEVQLQLAGGAGDDPLSPSESGSLSWASSEPATLTLLGLRAPVAALRVGALAGLALCAGLAGLLGLPLLAAARRSEDLSIQMRYGAQIADLAVPPEIDDLRPVAVGSIADLARLAERHGALILRERSGGQTRYMLQQGGLLYCYAPAAPEPDPAPPEPAPAPLPPAAPWQPRFLSALGETGLSAEASRAAGVDLLTAYREREQSPIFAEGWNAARRRAWERQHQRREAL